MVARPVPATEHSADGDLPQWLRPLVAAARAVRPEDLTRFLAPPDGGRDSAVLMLLGETDGEPDLLLTERASGMRAHSGQPAFPGGTQDPEDADAAACALREAQEEVGVNPSGVRIVAQLPQLWVPPTGFAVTPILGWWHTPNAVAPAEAEVAAAHRVPIDALADPANRVRVAHPSGFVGPGFEVADMIVWGFTGGLVASLLRLGGWERPWEPARVVQVQL